MARIDISYCIMVVLELPLSKVNKNNKDLLQFELKINKQTNKDINK